MTLKISNDTCPKKGTKRCGSLLVEILVLIPVVLVLVCLVFNTIELCDKLHMKLGETHSIEAAKECVLDELLTGTNPHELKTKDAFWRVDRICDKGKFYEVHISVDGFMERRSAVLMWPSTS